MSERSPRSAGLMGEFIGGSLTVHQAPGLGGLPRTVTIVDETRNCFYVRAPGQRRARVLPKAGLQGVLAVGAHEIPLSGDELRLRPEDRIKRLAPRGRSHRA